MFEKKVVFPIFHQDFHKFCRHNTVANLSTNHKLSTAIKSLLQQLLTAIQNSNQICTVSVTRRLNGSQATKTKHETEKNTTRGKLKLPALTLVLIQHLPGYQLQLTRSNEVTSNVPPRLLNSLSLVHVPTA
jgi:hypothetical protein